MYWCSYLPDLTWCDDHLWVPPAGLFQVKSKKIITNCHYVCLGWWCIMSRYLASIGYHDNTGDDIWQWQEGAPIRHLILYYVHVHDVTRWHWYTYCHVLWICVTLVLRGVLIMTVTLLIVQLCRQQHCGVGHGKSNYVGNNTVELAMAPAALFTERRPIMSL